MSHTKTISIYKFNGQSSELQNDEVAIEEPLELRLILGSSKTEKKLSVTMRTPGNDKDLAIGFLFTEGIIISYNDIETIYNHTFDANIIYVVLKPEIEISLSSLDRNFYTTSSCGVCGKSSIDAVKTQCKIKPNSNNHLTITSNILYELPNKLRQQQEAFNSTGGIHASAFFTKNGNFVALKEDVGRHNALDKLIGNMLIQNQLPIDQYILLLSGRASFELIQKAMMAGIKIIAAIGAPSSLAIELANESDITLIGFLKDGRMNIYTHPQRVK